MQNWVDPSRDAIVLRRVSTPEQVNNYSWKNQLDLAEVAHQDGFVHVEILDEAGVSGEKLENRAILQKVLARISAGNVGALYLMNFSRGSRDEDLIDGRLIMQACRKHHTIIRLPEGPLDLNRESDEDLADINFLFAKRYKRDMIKNMSNGEYRKAKEGGFVGGRPRFGYRYKYTLTETPRGPRMMVNWEIDPDEIEVVRFIHKHFSRFSTRRWACILNRLVRWGRVMPFPIKAAKDQERAGKKTREWQQHDIINIIKNNMLVGRLSYCVYDSPEYKRGKRERSRHLRHASPILIYREELRALDDETFDRNNRLLAERGKIPARTVSSRKAFSGILRCPICLAPLHSHGASSSQYLCSNYQHSGKSVCPGFVVNEIEVRDFILPWVTEILVTNIGPAVEAARQKRSSDLDVAEVRADLLRIEGEIKNLMAYARQGAITPEQLKEENMRLLAEKRDKQSRLEKLESTKLANKKSVPFTEEFISSLPDFLRYLYERKKTVFNQIVRSIFDGIVLNSALDGRSWKKGMTNLKYGKKTPRPCFLQAAFFNSSFRDWIDSDNLVLPSSLQSVYDQRCTTTGVPISAHS